MHEELVFNIWFIVDIGTSLCKYVITKPYNIIGSVEQKTEILKILSESDYLTAERIDFAENLTIHFSNQTIIGYIHKDNINQYFDINLDYFCNLVENQLPKTFQFKGGFLGENVATSQKLPEEPIFNLTFLMENEIGQIKPYTFAQNKEWYDSEVIRIDNLSKGFQN